MVYPCLLCEMQCAPGRQKLLWLWGCSRSHARAQGGYTGHFLQAPEAGGTQCSGFQVLLLQIKKTGGGELPEAGPAFTDLPFVSRGDGGVELHQGFLTSLMGTG